MEALSDILKGGVSAFAGGGAASFSVKTTAYTASSGDYIAADTSGGAWTLSLPASPVAGDKVEVVDAKCCCGTNNLTISGNGSRINGLSNNPALLASDGASARFVFVDNTVGWSVFGTAKCLTEIIPSYGVIVGGQGNLNIASSTINSTWGSARSNRGRSSGKYYFEYLHQRIAGTYSNMVGVGYATAALNNYVGADANGWGIVATGDRFNNGSSSAGAGYSAGDIVGITVDFTASTGSIAFYKNNSANGAYTSLTLSSPIFIYLSATSAGASGIIRTTAKQCAYSPPAGYSYWDS